MQIIVCKLVQLLCAIDNNAAKPKQCIGAMAGANKMLRQAGRIMKLTAILILGACLQIHAAGFGQGITLSERDVPIEKVLKKIQQQTDYKFLYTSQLLEGTSKVSIIVKNATVEEVLNMMFKDERLDYEVNEKTVIIRPKKTMPVKETTQSFIKDPIDVRGVITDENGAPAQNVNVVVKGTSKGTTTNLRGEFVIHDVAEGAVLLISSVGYDRQEIIVRKKDMISLQLKVAVGRLDETQVIAYGKTTRRFSTGNIGTVKASEIEQQPIQNPLLALQGRVPGIEVTQLTGLPGGAVKVRIQGQNSIGAGLDPLVVIDGVPFPTQLAGSQFMDGIVQQGSPLNYINPNDIESIDVLKDADATAIYGSRAANGAILITTKKGKAGRSRLSVSGEQGWGKVTRKVDMMNTRQYLDMRYEAYKNDGINISTLIPNSSNYDLTLWDTTRYTDWQKELIGGMAHYTNLNVGMSGGTTTLQYLVGATYNRQTTVFPGDFDNKVGALHFNINGTSANQRLKMQLTGNYSYNQNHLPGVDLTRQAILFEPNAPPLFKDDGTLNWAPNVAGNSTWTNPLAYTTNSDYNNATKNLVSNLILSYRILTGFEISSSFGYTNTISEIYAPTRLGYYAPERQPRAVRIASFGNRNMSSWIVEPQLKYSGRIVKGKVDAFVGSTIQKSTADFLNVTGSGFTNDLLMKTLRAANSVTINASNSIINRFNALFGRLNYNWGDKYLININARRDGSNKFGDKNKFHNFGSIGLGWVFSQESWLQKNYSILSFGKIRGSYGTTGNDQIPDFAYLSIYGINNPSILYQNNIGLDVTNIPNPYLQWEETRKWQGGIDLGFVNDRVILGLTYARNRSSNQLTGFPLPLITGFSGITQNLPATIQNTSWELTLNTVNVKSGKLTWNTSANLTIGRNKVVSFPGIESTAFADSNSGIIVGQPIGVKRVTHYVGIDPNSGLPLFIDKNGTPSYSNPLKTDVLLSNLTKYYGGLVNSVCFKNFQLEFLIQFVHKIDTRDMFWYNGNFSPGRYANGYSNQPITVMGRWQKPGSDASRPPYSTLNHVFFGIYNGSDAGYGPDASYIRLKNISLSWQFPARWLKNTGLLSARIYAHAQNLFTITKYKGLDPETMSINTLPPLRMITLGGNLEF